MTSPQRFPKGVTNAKAESPFGQFLQPDPRLVYGYFNDFFQYAATDWVLTTQEAGAGSATEVIASDETGGAFDVIGGSGKWAGATGNGKFVRVIQSDEGNKNVFEVEITVP